MRFVLLGILINLVSAIIGVSGTFAFRLIMYVIPARRLWSFSDPDHVAVLISASNATVENEYKRVFTGLGQLRALALIMRSIERGYRKARYARILFSGEIAADDLATDVILLGGPKNNVWTARTFSELRLEQTDRYISWPMASGFEKVEAIFEKGTVQKDYGLIVRKRNPYTNHRSILHAFSGIHTSGTAAAAKYYVERAKPRRISHRSSRLAHVILVSCELSDGLPVGITRCGEWVVRRKEGQLKVEPV